jgi:hypothetical protein
VAQVADVNVQEYRIELEPPLVSVQITPEQETRLRFLVRFCP